MITLVDSLMCRWLYIYTKFLKKYLNHPRMFIADCETRILKKKSLIHFLFVVIIEQS